MRLETLTGLERLDWIATRYHQRPSTLLGISNPVTAYRVDEATLLAGVLAEERIRAEARDEAKNGTPASDRPGDRPARDEPATISTGDGGLQLKGTARVSNDRTPEEIANADRYARAQGWTVGRSD